MTTVSEPHSQDIAHTVIGLGARFSGKLIFEGRVRIDGHFEGEVTSEGTLVIGPEAQVKADINIGHVIIYGEVEGDISANACVELRASAKVKGQLLTSAIVAEQGAVFNGTCTMTTSNISEAPTPLSMVSDSSEP